MKVERIVLRFVRIPLKSEFRNRWQRIQEWTKLIVELRSGDAVGYGECMAMETPFYSYETIDTAWWVITRWLARPMLESDFQRPDQVTSAFSLISGHHEGKAALECAFWDLWSRAHEQPLYEAIGGCRRPVCSGATIGIQEDLATAIRLARVAVDAGYRRLKIKIKPGWDRELIEAVRAEFPDVTILADANGAYGEEDIDWLASLERFEPIIIEQPFPASAWSQLAGLQARTSAPVCLDESVNSLEDLGQMLHFKAARMVNLKIGRVGGISEAIRIHDRCAEAGIPIFVGSKAEMGIGRWTNVAVSTLENVRYPSDVPASDRYFTDEIVNDPVMLVAPGTVEPLPGPGFGTDVDRANLLNYTVRTLSIPE
jgi:O-succinylbenzoate synthase